MRWRSKRKLPVIPAEELPNDPLVAVPIRMKGVEAVPNRIGELVLRRQLHPGQGWHSRIVAALRQDYSMQLRLDQRGCYFWDLIDGQRDLRRIADTIRREFQLEKKESRDATVLFVKELMTRGLIQIRLPRLQKTQ